MGDQQQVDVKVRAASKLRRHTRMLHGGGVRMIHVSSDICTCSFEVARTAQLWVPGPVT